MMIYKMTNTDTNKNMASQIILKKPSELLPYRFNNKIHKPRQIELIANSITEMGFQNPILIDDDNVVIAGHARLEAAKKLSMEHVPCIMVVNLTKDQIKKLRILDNRLSEVESEDDIENIKHEVNELDDPTLYDLFPGLFAPEEDQELQERQARTGYIKLKSTSNDKLYDLLEKIQPIVDEYDGDIVIMFGGTMKTSNE